MKPKRAASLAERVAALRSAGSQACRSEVDELLTECAAALLALSAEVRRVDRRLHGAVQTADEGLEALAEARRLADRRNQLDREHSSLSKLIADLRGRRAGLAGG